MTRLAVALPLVLAAASAAETLDLTSPVLIEAGSALFAKNCAVGYCRGSEGRPARGPALRDRPWDPAEFYRITREGRASMPAWKEMLPDRDIWAVTAYAMTLASEPPTAEQARVELGAAESGAVKSLSEEAARGRELFFDLTRERRCGPCRRIGERGTAIGPNLALAAPKMSETELRRAVLEPAASIAFGYENATVVTVTGEKITGVLQGRDERTVKIHDVAAPPPVPRTVPTERVREVSAAPGSPMSRLDDSYPEDALAALIAYLREL